MKSASSRTALLMSVLTVFILACGIPSTDETSAAPTEATIVETPGITHEIIPVNLPVDRSSHAGDYDSSTTADKRAAAGGDRFTFGRFERPFNADIMDTYFPEIDIIDTSVFQDETWIYGKVIVKGNVSNKLSGQYGLELDTDLDGKGDWLIVASQPSSNQWTTDGVRVYQDSNKGVGDASAMYTDENSTGDGFEFVAFDAGQGSDPDAAWARVSPDQPNIVEISVKRSLLGNPEKYLINMWAGNSLDPALFDMNDHFTHEQAGAADPGLDIFYPIKAVAEVDNSCRMAVGFQPTGQEPGLCEVLMPSVPGQGCTSTPAMVLACQLNNDPSYDCSWNKNSCSCNCEYVGPR